MKWGGGGSPRTNNKTVIRYWIQKNERNTIEFLISLLDNLRPFFRPPPSSDILKFRSRRSLFYFLKIIQTRFKNSFFRHSIFLSQLRSISLLFSRSKPVPLFQFSLFFFQMTIRLILLLFMAIGVEVVSSNQHSVLERYEERLNSALSKRTGVPRTVKRCLQNSFHFLHSLKHQHNPKEERFWPLDLIPCLILRLIRL